MSMSSSQKILSVLVDLQEELAVAYSKYGDFASAHEGYAVIKEELEELWTEIKKKKEERNKANMKREALQVAAMATKFILFLERETQ